MTTSGTILPDNSTPLERALDTTADKRLALDTPKPMDVESLPAHLLSHLALTLSVDVWEENWSETSKRTVLKQAIQTHMHKGTVRSLREVLAYEGVGIEVLEWYDQRPQGRPRTFVLKMTSSTGGEEELKGKIKEIVNRTKPAGVHYTIETPGDANNYKIPADLFLWMGIRLMKIIQIDIGG